MRIEPAVKQTTKRIAMGTCVLCVLQYAIFLGVQRHFDYTVILGILLGGSLAILNFFLLALGVQKAARKAPESASPSTSSDGQHTDEEQEDDPPLSQEQIAAQKAIRKTVQTSYYLRMLLLVIVCAVAISLPCFHTLATLIPLLFPRLVITIQGLVSAGKEK